MRTWVASSLALFALTLSSPVRAIEADIARELQRLKRKVAELEKMLEEETKKEKGYEEAKAELKDIKDIILKRFGTLSIHGGVVGYYQGMTEPEIGETEFDNPNGAGFAADLELAWSPIENGEFYLRLHAGEGDGADRDKEEVAFFADVNTINDDNPDGQFLDLLEAWYSHVFFDGLLFLAAGKTEPVVFIDDNAFSNDENSQFIGKPFVNDPVLDSEDEFGPLVALGFSPWERVSLMVLGQSSSHADQKDIWEKVFDQPFVAGQLAYAPSFGGLEGNYRVYGWSATYDHPTLTDASANDKGWGVGLSMNQKVHDQIGLFGRLGYHNDEVYLVDWSWSFGANIKGLIPGRSEDEIGIAVAGLHANEDIEDLDPDLETDLLLGEDNDGMEYHLETYYRIALTDFFAITPDVQYVINPLGDSENDDVFVGTLRTEFSF